MDFYVDYSFKLTKLWGEQYGDGIIYVGGFDSLAIVSTTVEIYYEFFNKRVSYDGNGRSFIL